MSADVAFDEHREPCAIRSVDVCGKGVEDVGAGSQALIVKVSECRWLDERERSILLHRYGLQQGSEPLTLEEVGTRFGVTKERIRQIEARALQKLRKIAEEEKLDIPGV